uniref:Uncharacterized protein n=1 Tax=Lotharella vacuolata TaxID=74820 RepID=A0A0H5BQR8_9EUKA|nr:hypothetical protein [Lotharella vacuolata]
MISTELRNRLGISCTVTHNYLIILFCTLYIIFVNILHTTVLYRIISIKLMIIMVLKI